MSKIVVLLKNSLVSSSNCRVLLVTAFTLCCSSFSFATMHSLNKDSFPEVGNRVYSIVDDRKDDAALAEPATIVPSEVGEKGLKDPISDREIKVKSIIGKSRYVSLIDISEDKEKVKTAYVTLNPMAISGKSNEPSIRLNIDREDISSSDAMNSPKLIRGIFSDAKKLK